MSWQSSAVCMLGELSLHARSQEPPFAEAMHAPVLAFSLTLSPSKQTNLSLAGVGQGGVCSVSFQALVGTK